MIQNTMTNTLKWLGTLTLIVGVGFNSLNIYPLGPLIMCLGGVIWVIVGYMWREYSIIITNSVLTLVSLIGISIKYGFFS
jgi:hypothetical protein